MARESIHGQWSSRWIFILAATGSAVGLGNIWKFPYIAGENGGGAFVLIYLLCIALIGLPIMMAEVMLGRRGRQSPINTMHTLALEAGHNPHWKWLGWLGVIVGFLILSYYSVIAGWVVAYIFRTGSGMFTDITADGVVNKFESFVADPEIVLLWHTLFMVITMLVVARGVRSGLEKAVKFLMPGLFLLLLIMVGYAMSMGEFSQAVSFLFNPDFSRITAEGILTAMGHAFFTLSLGMGAIMVYGSYLPADASIAKTSITIAIADTLVALMASLAIFPIIFANGLEPDIGIGLIFQTLPLAFGHMPSGVFFGTLFFILLAFAAWTSSISIVEPVVAWMVETLGMKRIQASVVIGLLCWAIGLLSAFSTNIWKNITPLDMFTRFEGKTMLDLLDYFTSNVLLPLGGFLIAIFAGWIMSLEASRDELGMGESTAYMAWRFVLRYFTPIAILVVFLHAIEVVKF